MTYTEIYKDLFELENTHTLAHCISGDLALGEGIAREFDKRYNMRKKIMQNYSSNVYQVYGPTAILVENKYNLVTKDRYFEKPTYTALEKALIAMRNSMVYRNLTELAMPMIGSGLDRLKWFKVSEIIKDVFKDTDINITICKLEKPKRVIQRS